MEAPYRLSSKLLATLDNFRRQHDLLVLKDTRVLPEACPGRRGAFGQIVELDRRGTILAGKRLHEILCRASEEDNDNQVVLTKYLQEITFLKEMRHQNIVQFIGLHYESDSPIPLLVMELMKQSLTKFLENIKRGSLPRQEILKILLDVAEGLRYLHEEKEISHRDLSSNNILLTGELHAKIADFGSARVLNKPKWWKPAPVMTQAPGTLPFMPPEVLKEEPCYTLSVDIFSFGCVIIHIISYQWPSPSSKHKATEFEKRSKYTSDMDHNDPLLQVIKHCLNGKPQDRPTVKDLKISLYKISSNSEDYTIVFCGPSGVGKSCAAAFYSSALLTTRSEVASKKIQIVETSGSFYNFAPAPQELSHTCVLTRNGLHALVLVINLKLATLQGDVTKHLLLIQRLKDFRPFAFLLFTNAGEEAISRPDCHQNILRHYPAFKYLKKLLKIVDYRVLMVESCDHVCGAVNYKDQKCKELLEMIDKVSQNRKYFDPLLGITAKIYEQEKHRQEGNIDKVLMTLEIKKAQLNKLLNKTERNTRDIKKIEDEIKTCDMELKQIFGNVQISTEKQFEKAINVNRKYYGASIFYQKLTISLEENYSLMPRATIGGAVGGAGGGLGAGTIGGTIGGGIGTFFSPGLGTLVGIAIGATIGGAVGVVGGAAGGAAGGFAVNKILSNKDACNPQ